MLSWSVQNNEVELFSNIISRATQRVLLVGGWVVGPRAVCTWAELDAQGIPAEWGQWLLVTESGPSRGGCGQRGSRLPAGAVREAVWGRGGGVEENTGFNPALPFLTVGTWASHSLAESLFLIVKRGKSELWGLAGG